MLTRKELAERMKVSERTIDRYVKLGMPCIKVVGAVRFDLQKVTEWLEQQRK